MNRLLSTRAFPQDRKCFLFSGDAHAWRADRGTIEPNRRARRSCTFSGVRACSAAGAEPRATLDDAGIAEGHHLPPLLGLQSVQQGP